jgi:hypothetical protein
MGVGELYGCDLDIHPILEMIPPGSDFIDVQTYLQHAVVEALLDKLDKGGTTVLLDIDRLNGTPAAALIPRILELREKEMENLSIPVLGREIVIYDLDMNEIGSEILTGSGESVLLRNLWLTAKGYEILTNLKMGLRTTTRGLERIKSEFKKAGIKYNLGKVDNETELTPCLVSEAMMTLIMKIIGRR